jgi:pimeloyl-ACP methyl ester carboxylesterase
MAMPKHRLRVAGTLRSRAPFSAAFFVYLSRTHMVSAQLPQVRIDDVQCITAGGLHRMSYREWGDPHNDRVLVCVHGLTRVSNDFDAFAQAVASDYRVICPDVAGRGRSGWLSNPMLYQIPTYVGDMVTLLARLDAKTLHWFGTSMGALIGMVLAALPDSPIERMILNDAGPVLEAAAIARIGSYVGDTPRFATIDEAEAYIRKITAPFGEHSDAEWRFLTEVVMRKDGNAWVRHFDPALAVPFKSLPQTDTTLWHLYDAIKCPVLSVRGEHSDLLSAATHAEMAARGPRAELVTIANVGHAPTFMHDDQIGIAKNFLLAGR